VKTYLFISFYLCLNILFGQGVDKVQLLNANSLVFDMQSTGKVKRLIGDVRFKQRNTLLYCDSAYQYDEENKVEAFGSVRINQQDSINLYGNYLLYDGNTKHASLQGDARMVDKDMTLTSSTLEYDMATNFGYYNNGGRLINGNNILTSKNGYYFGNTKETFFKNNVVLTNPDYVINTDTLKYKTGNKIAEFYGPTKITSKSDILYCKVGKYDTEKEIAMFGKNAVVVSKNNILTADSIYYEKLTQFGKAFKNIEMYDTTNNVVVYGDYGEMFGKLGLSIVTKNAVAKQYMKNDSMYLFSDTIISYQMAATGKQMVKAFRKVKLIKSDMQAICDSLTYNKSDSSINLYKKPIMWSGSNQITADSITLFLKNNVLDSFVLRTNAFLISRETARQFNQIKGKNMYGFFEGNAIKFLHVNGNAQSIYYAKQDSDYIGVNTEDCSEMEFNFKMNKIDRCNFINQPFAVLHPINELKPEDLKLKGFIWLNNLRPTQALIMKRFYGKNNFLKKTLFGALIYQ